MFKKSIKGIAIVFLSALLGITGRNLTMKDTLAVDAEAVQQGISSEIIRFHVLANSDREEDQVLKIRVKDELLKYLEVMLKDAKDIETTRETILNHLEDIEFEASEYIKEQGYSYDVKADLEYTYFPMKIYGDYTFPAGKYEALRIKIGEAEGKNWWCVMFPNLCFIDGTYAVVTEEQKQELKNILTEEEYETITGTNHVKIKFKYLTFLNGEE